MKYQIQLTTTDKPLNGILWDSVTDMIAGQTLISGKTRFFFYGHGIGCASFSKEESYTYQGICSDGDLYMNRYRRHASSRLPLDKFYQQVFVVGK